VITAEPGATLARPRWADALESGDAGDMTGRRTALAESFEAPTRPGTYFLTRGDRRVGALVVDPPADESILDRFTPDELRDRLRAGRTVVAPDAPSWTALAFRAAARRSLIEPALLIALVMLITEAIAIGARSRRVSFS
jgi:hypothetical protein